MSIFDLRADFQAWWLEDVPTQFPEPRDAVSSILAHIGREDDRRALLVLGPRQVGKSVALAHVARALSREGLDPARIALFDFSDERAVAAGVTPRDVVENAVAGLGRGDSFVFLFDEIARVENWELWLKQAVDRGNHRIVVTDSSARLLRTGGRETGPGRWDQLRIEPLTYSEFCRVGPTSDPTRALLRYLEIGGFPEHIAAEETRTLRARLRSDLAEKAVQAELLASGVDAVRARRMFVYLTKRSGAVFVRSAIARDLGSDQRSIGRWLELLQDMSLLWPLPKMTGSARSEMRAHPKVYAADHGMVLAFTDTGDAAGAVHETVVYRHLRELARREGLRVGYLSKSRRELDFVVFGRDVMQAVEVTASREVSRAKLAKIEESAAFFGVKRPVVVYTGVESRERRGVRLVPLHEFLRDPGVVTDDA